MKRLLLTVSSIALVAFGQTAAARPVHGLAPASCAHGMGWNDKCADAPPDGSVYFPNFFTDSTTGFVRHGVARQSGQAAYVVTPSNNTAGVVTHVGWSAAEAGGALKDASIQSNLPTACTYYPTGNSIGGPLIQCQKGVNLYFHNLEFNPGGNHCIALELGGGGIQNGNTGSLTVRNVHFKNGLGCSIVHATGSSGGQGDSFQGYITGTTLCVIGSASQGSVEVPTAPYGGWPILEYEGTGNVSHLTITNNAGGTAIIGSGGSCPSGGSPYALTILQIFGTAANPLTITEQTGSGPVVFQGYVNGRILCDQTGTAVAPATGGYAVSDAGNNILANTQIISAGGSCPDGGTPYVIAVTTNQTVGSAASPFTFMEETPTLYITALAGVNGNTLASGIAAGHGSAAQGQDYLKQNNDFTQNQAISGKVSSCSPNPDCTSPTSIQLNGYGYAPPQSITFGLTVGTLFFSVNGGNAFTDFDISRAEFDGSARDLNCCALSMQAVGILNISGNATYSHSGLYDFRSRPLSFGALQNTTFSDVFIEDFAFNPNDGHSEAFVDTVGVNPLPSIQWNNATILLSADVMPGGTAPIWLDTGNSGQHLTQGTIKNSAIVVNTHGGAGGAAAMSGMVELDYMTYDALTFDHNFFDGESFSGQPTCFKTAKTTMDPSMGPALTNNPNFDMTTGLKVTLWGHTCSYPSYPQ